MKLAFILLLTLALWWIWRGRQAAAIRRADEHWLPEELRQATLKYSERRFFRAKPFPLVARVDRGYQLPSGAIVLLDFKRRMRARAYESDIVEVSAQRIAMLGADVRDVADHGYIVVVHPYLGTKTAIRIGLQDEASVWRRYKHFTQVRQGDASASRTRNPAICAHCGHRAKCPDPA